MMVDKIRKLSIIGAGYLGKQIIEKSLLFNYDVNVFDINMEDLEIFTEKMNDKIAKENLTGIITQYSTIAEAVKEFGVFDKVDHRILIIPGMAARLSGALEDEADAYVVVGPRDSSGIGKYMKEQWKPEEFMKIYAEMNE